jgi:hypothetical protein
MMAWTPVAEGSIDLSNYRRELVLVEEVLRQRVEFWDELRRIFSLGDGLPRRRFLYRAGSGGLYDLVFIGRTDEPFPSGMEFWYLADGFDPLPPRPVIDGDLWDFAHDLIAGVEARSPGAASVAVFEQFLRRPA